MKKSFKHLPKKITKAVYSVFLICIALIVVTLGYQLKIGNTPEARSATYYDFHGQAWSDNIGWISFNCLEGGVGAANICGTSNYKVSTDAVGTMNGYAWSDNIGWISFNENTGCPSAPCRPQLNAGSITGWARAISPFVPTDPNPDRGGWDGWIDLSQVTRTGNDLANAAFGDINVGWMSFNCINGSPTNGNICGTSNYKVYVTATTIPDPTLVFTVPSHAFIGDNPTVSWTATNIDSCTASGNWTGAKAIPSGTQSLGVYSTQGSYTYTLTCNNSVYTTSIVATRIVNVTDGLCTGAETTTGDPFDCTSVVNRFEANPKIVKPGKTSRLEWNIVGGQSCAIYNPANALVTSIPNGNQIGSIATPAITVKTVYRLTCLGGLSKYTTVSPYLLYEY